MIPIKETIEVPAPLERVWPLLNDPALVVTCVPGAQLGADKGNGTYEGSIAVSFGPIKAVFRGEADLAYDQAAKTCKIGGRGQDQRGQSRANASALISALAEGPNTRLTVDGTFNVSGPLAQFARTGGVHLARQLLAEFSTNLSARLTEREGQTDASSAATATAASGPRELQGFALLWRALVAWIASMFGRGKAPNADEPAPKQTGGRQS
jgi:carbon monoxide dehydrogenase subunit G